MAVTFNKGNVYSTINSYNIKTYYLAVEDKTLVSYKNKKFGTYSIAKEKGLFKHEENLAVKSLVKYWKVDLKHFDKHMKKYFSPDKEALLHARRERTPIFITY